MGITKAYTLTEARAMKELWKACEQALAEGQAKEYRVGSRTFTSIDLADIAKRINYFANLEDALEKGRSSARARVVVPRDL